MYDFITVNMINVELEYDRINQPSSGRESVTASREFFSAFRTSVGTGLIRLGKLVKPSESSCDQTGDSHRHVLGHA